MSILRQTAKSNGIVSETMVIAAFTNLGYQVSLPYGDNAPYDLIADIDNKLCRVQVKTAIYSKVQSRKGSLIVKTCRSQKKIVEGVIKGSTIRPYTKEEIDFIACYCVKYKKVYLIPVRKIKHRTCITLRFENNEGISVIRKDVYKAQDYEVYAF